MCARWRYGRGFPCILTLPVFSGEGISTCRLPWSALFISEHAGQKSAHSHERSCPWRIAVLVCLARTSVPHLLSRLFCSVYGYNRSVLLNSRLREIPSLEYGFICRRRCNTALHQDEEKESVSGRGWHSMLIRVPRLRLIHHRIQRAA